MIETIEELEERLSRPGPGLDVELARVPGDLLVLGAGGKMGPSLARMARRARGAPSVVAVSRFSDRAAREALEADGVRTISCDLLDRAAVDGLPDAAAVVLMAGVKFGTSTAPAATWAANAVLPTFVAERYAGVPTVVFSSGNVYPLLPVTGPGAGEDTAPAPRGEYASSVLARERVFEHFAQARGTPSLLFRLNYATELRYGVLVEIAAAVHARTPIDLAMGHVNVIWQGDANDWALRCLNLCAVPPRVLNAAGPAFSVRDLAQRCAERLGEAPVFRDRERDTALLSDARRAARELGPPRVSIDQLVDWVSHWVANHGPTLSKPTRFQVRDGAF